MRSYTDENKGGPMKYILIALLVASCATMPGDVTTYKSSYDGQEYAEVTPGWLNSTNSLLLGLRRSSAMKDGQAVLVVKNYMIKHFSSAKDSLLIRIDGTEYKFSTKQKTDCQLSTQHENGHCTTEYPFTLDMANKMLNGQEVLVKVVLREGHVEGVFSDRMMSAKSAFKNFIAHYEKSNGRATASSK